MERHIRRQSCGWKLLPLAYAVCAVWGASTSIAQPTGSYPGPYRGGSTSGGGPTSVNYDMQGCGDPGPAYGFPWSKYLVEGFGKAKDISWSFLMFGSGTYEEDKTTNASTVQIGVGLQRYPGDENDAQRPRGQGRDYIPGGWSAACIFVKSKVAYLSYRIPVMLRFKQGAEASLDRSTQGSNSVGIGTGGVTDPVAGGSAQTGGSFNSTSSFATPEIFWDALCAMKARYKDMEMNCETLVQVCGTQNAQPIGNSNVLTNYSVSVENIFSGGATPYGMNVQVKYVALDPSGTKRLGASTAEVFKRNLEIYGKYAERYYHLDKAGKIKPEWTDKPDYLREVATMIQKELKPSPVNITAYRGGWCK